MKKALVVDDNANNLTLEKDLLEIAGFEVFVSENAAGGIAIARKEKPDIIIMDVRLPDMRGTEAARILRQEKETSGYPDCFCNRFGNGRGYRGDKKYHEQRIHRQTDKYAHFCERNQSIYQVNFDMLKRTKSQENNMKAKPVILVVDDQTQNNELLEAYLVPAGV